MELGSRSKKVSATIYSHYAQASDVLVIIVSGHQCLVEPFIGLFRFLCFASQLHVATILLLDPLLTVGKGRGQVVGEVVMVLLPFFSFSFFFL